MKNITRYWSGFTNAAESREDADVVEGAGAGEVLEGGLDHRKIRNGQESPNIGWITWKQLGLNQREERF